MNFIQTVYYNDKALVVTADADTCVLDHTEMKSYVRMKGLTKANLPLALQQLDDIMVQGVIIEESSISTFYTHLKDMYKVIRAGGGLVYNENKDILMIFRRGKWDLPKGKLDKGEQIEACALREVCEETGLNMLCLGPKITETWHLYPEKGKNFVKHTTWYRMEGTSMETFLPQAEEDIQEVLWVNTGKLLPFVSNTYKAIRDVLAMEGLAW
ncbi:MAG: NUDIX domain-containing protein [Taibaiella sp.]|nr:NUDIX domain-containing protein [Taibaiella sp.]